MKPRVLVVAFGNPLMGDDGVGPAVLEQLRQGPLPPWVRLEDGGTDATCLLRLWRGEETVILVDAARLEAPPGTVHCLSLDQLLALRQTPQHAHALSLPSCLAWVLLARPELAKAKVQLVAVEPEKLGCRHGLSLAAAMGARAVVARIRSLLALKAGRQ